MYVNAKMNSTFAFQNYDKVIPPNQLLNYSKIVLHFKIEKSVV